MSQHSLISWCDDTANFIRECDKVSPGCAHCYITRTPPFRMSGMKHGDPRVLSEGAFALAHRLNRKPWVCNECGGAYADRNAVCCPDHSPHKKHRRRIFSLSLGDWLDPKIPIGWLARMLDTIRQCDQVRWLLLTKRPELWAERLIAVEDYDRSKTAVRGLSAVGVFTSDWLKGYPPANVLIGTSVEDQQRADERIPHLLRIPAAGRFLSIEPLLGPVDPTRIEDADGNTLDCLTGDWGIDGRGHTGPRPEHIHWLIIGGESGPKARPCNVEWIRLLVRQGREAGVATFVKQCGSRFHDWGEMMNRRILLKHPKGGDPSEWPEDLRVREYPEVLL